VKILIINGPNLNLLGKRQPDVYGNKSFTDIFEMLKTEFSGQTLSYFQSNHEGEIIDQIHHAEGVYSGIVLNAGAYTHTSIAIADAISSVDVPVVEVHISNIYKRESFRHKSMIAPYCMGTISGFGTDSYRLGIQSIIQSAKNK
jgi:3-dehydroquinate dehydratase II